MAGCKAPPPPPVPPQTSTGGNSGAGGSPSPQPNPDPQPRPQCGVADGASVGNPINLFTGEKLHFETLFQDQGTHDLSVYLNYRSLRSDLSDWGIPSSKWEWSPQVRLLFHSADTSRLGYTVGAASPSEFQNKGFFASVLLALSRIAGLASSEAVANNVAFPMLYARAIMPDGTESNFSTELRGLGQPEVYRHEYAGPDTLEPTTLADGAAGYKYTRKSDGSQYFFTKPALTKEPALLRYSILRNGWKMSYTYNAAKQLVALQNQFGRRVSLEYDANGYPAAVVAPHGARTRIQLDSTGRLTQLTHPDNNTKQYLYENTAHPHALTGVVDENKSRISTYAYNSDGLAISTELTGGVKKYSMSYWKTRPYEATPVDGYNLEATVRNDSTGYTRKFKYALNNGHYGIVDSSDRPESLEYSAVRNRTYDANGLVTKETDFNWNAVETIYEWDTVRRLPTKITRAANKPEALSTTLQWHPTEELLLQTTTAHQTTTFTYDTRHNLLSGNVQDTQTAAQAITRWEYNALSLKTAEIDALGNKIRYIYDARGHLSQVINPLGHTTTYEYDAAGRMLRTIDPNGVSTLYTYDARNRVTSKVQRPKSGAPMEADYFAYRPSGELIKASLATGQVLDYTYDAISRLTKVSSNQGWAFQYTWTNFNKIAPVDAIGAAGQSDWYLVNRYHSYSSLLQSTQVGLSAAETYSYDARGRVGQYGGRSPTKNILRDSLERFIGEESMYGQSAGKYTLDPLGQTTEAIDPKGVKTTYQVDALGRVYSEASPDTGTNKASYDAAGRVINVTSPKGERTDYSYDALNRIVKITYTGGRSVSLAYDNTANGIGRLVSITESNTTANNHVHIVTRYTYNPLGRIASKSQQFQNGTPHTLNYTYRAGGLLERVDYPSGRGVQYSYTNGRITDVATSSSKTATVQAFVSGITYNALYQPTAWTWRGGDSAARSYDVSGRMTQTEFARYTFDSLDRITTIKHDLFQPTTTTPNTYTTQTSTVNLQYDERHRLTRLTSSGDNSAASIDHFFLEIYGYDLNQNPLQSRHHTSDKNQKWTDKTLEVSANNTSNKLGAISLKIASNSSGVNQEKTTTITPEYDAAGKLLNDLDNPNLRYTYDAQDRLASVKNTSSATPLTTQYEHTILGQRIYKSASLAPPPPPPPTTWFTIILEHLYRLLGITPPAAKRAGMAYVYDEAGDLLAEYPIHGHTAPTVEYIWLPAVDMSASAGSAGFTESAGSKTLIGAVINGVYYSVHTDHLGTPRLIKDAKNQPVWQWAYSGFGQNHPAIAQNGFKPNTPVAAGQFTFNLFTAMPRRKLNERAN